MGRYARWVLPASFLLAAATIGLWYWFRVPTYSTSTDTRPKIREAEKAAVRHTRVLVVFGGNWCSDCHVLDELFERTKLASVLSENFEVVRQRRDWG